MVALFRWLIDQAMLFARFVYPLLRSQPLWLIPYLIATVIIWGLLSLVIVKDQTDLLGSGVPQIEAILKDQHRMKWWPVLWKKFVGGLLAICPGLFLGREGPCIQMGAAIGQGMGERLFHADREENKLLLSCGVAAGLVAAFSAPLAGTMFLLEGITFRFQIREWLTALAAAISADLMTVLVYGTRPCLWLPVKFNLPTAAYPWLILFGLVLGVLAWCYQYCLLNSRVWYRHCTHLPSKVQPLLPLLLVIPVGLLDVNLLGGCHMLIALPSHSAGFASLFGLLSIYFVVRFIGSMLSYGVPVPGGIFMPILVLGAILGALLATLLIHLHLLAAGNYINLVVIGMAAYFGAIEKAPFTAICLLTEMVGIMEQILPMLIVTFISYTVNDLLGGRPIYAALREKMFGLDQTS
ncbi:ClC family H(+)/Cl(-) exchange transporter [Limosilactobacillus fermentum]|uniref:ClC family H(+)/Cl(-) exchange transporter n=1 Tax=Limosilactobacillus fermentum TaxID=1613 RepID=UPI0021A6A00D|nr:ClC family H(+)/Cl(-) exchange transporter [Limosilactobacillus fermentum]